MPADLTALRSLLSAATAGEWDTDGKYDVGAGGRHVASADAYDGSGRIYPDSFANAALIAAAVSALPALLDRLEAAEAVVVAAHNFIQASPCDPDITDNQWAAYDFYGHARAKWAKTLDAAAGMGEGK